MVKTIRYTNDIYQGISCPNFVKVDLFDSATMHLSFSFCEAAKNFESLFFDDFLKVCGGNNFFNVLQMSMRLCIGNCYLYAGGGERVFCDFECFQCAARNIEGIDCILRLL